MSTALISVDEQIADEIIKYTWNPLGHAMFAFPWGEKGTELAKDKAPRQWQMEGLSDLTLHLSNPATRHTPFRMARSSGHGIGKSAMIGMVSKWAIDTCDRTRVVITANTEGQLRTKTAPEVAKWHRMAITSHWFKTETTSIHARGEEAKNWRVDFTPWSEHNTEAFAGLHNKGKRIVIIFDEGSAISDKIWEVTEGALTDADTEIIWIVFGNPTRNVGRFRECFRKYSALWNTRKIDSRNVEGTNKVLFKQWEETYGEDSDFFKIRVRGEFPSASAKQLYPTDLIDAARKRELKRDQFGFATTVISVDPSWEGDDDLIIGIRQGLHYRITHVIHKNENDIAIANIVARLEDEVKADAVFVDGGYGTGIISAGRTLNRNWQIVWFSEKSGREDCVNKRAEMHVEVLDWLRLGGSIPHDDDELYEEMLAIETLPMLDGKYKLPPKDAIKEIVGRSPNKIDNLALTFAYPVAPKFKPGDIGALLRAKRRQHDHDPMDETDNLY